MKRVNLAFETLGTAEARAAYDAQRASGPPSGRRKRPRGRTGSRRHNDKVQKHG